MESYEIHDDQICMLTISFMNIHAKLHPLWKIIKKKALEQRKHLPGSLV